MNIETTRRIAQAIAEHGSRAYTTPSGAVLELMRQLASEDDLTRFSLAFVIIARAKPANANFISARVPGIVSNFLIRHRGIDGGAMGKWATSNPGWADELKAAVRDPERFPRVVEAMAEAIKQDRIKQ